jgi:hypothetical protein
MTVRDRIDAAFEAWGRLIVQHRWKAILIMLLLSLVPGTQLPEVEIKNSLQDNLHSDDPTRVLYESFREQFGRDELIIIGIEPSAVFDLDFLAMLRSLHRDLEEQVPHLDEITSLINARHTRTSGDALIVEPLLEQWPETSEDLAELERQVLSNPLFSNILISEDGRFTTITVKPSAYSAIRSTADELVGFDDSESSPEIAAPQFPTDAENIELMEAIRAVLDAHESSDVAFHLAGGPVLEERSDTIMLDDVARLTGVSVIAIAGLLFALFRNVWAVALPLVVVGLSLLSAIGLMVLLGISLSITTEFMPAFLLTVGVCDSVHLLTIFFQRFRGGASKQDSIAYALRDTGPAILMTSLTTAAGLAAFATADLIPVAFLGIIAPLGVMLALVFTVTLLPALLAVAPVRVGSHRSGSYQSSLLTRALLACGDLGTRRPWSIVGAAALLLLLALLGTSRVRFGQNELLWFPKEEPLRHATELLDRKLKGVMSVEVLIETHEEYALYEPALLRQLEEIARSNESDRSGELYVGKTVSIVDIIKEIHRALNDDRPEYYMIPDEREAVAQELLLFENAGSDDLEDVTDVRFSTGRLSLKVPWVDASFYPDFLDQLEQRIREIVDDDVEVKITGMSALKGRILAAIIATTVKSYVIAFLLITPMMVLFVGSLRRGLLSMIPNLAPVVLTLGIMGWAGIPVEGSSLLVGAIIMGLAVDDTIHFMHKFGQYYEQSRDVRSAVRETLATTGWALLITTLVLSAGFFSFTIAYMTNIAVFGALAGFATLAAFLADVLLGPALVTLATRWEQRDATIASGRH